MRLWTLHPKYLDARGLVALWREALLAQAVLGGHTRGYTRHPQLIRFLAAQSPLGSIAAYLQAVYDEACRRAYRFDQTKIMAIGRFETIETTLGQIDYEWQHLKAKLQLRDPSWLAGLTLHAHPVAHPLFRIVPGSVENWEIGASAK
jgi:hypothetical protein